MEFQSLIFPLLIALLAVPLFLQARKQKKVVQEQQKLQSSLAVGDRVMTTSGLFGTVVETADDSIDLEVAPGVTTTWVRAAVREKVTTEASEAAVAADEEPASDKAEPASEKAEPASEKAEPASGAKDEATESKAEVAEPIEKQKTN